MDDPAAAFHAHLNVCEQCEKHPFNLCHVGALLIQKAMDKLQDEIRSARTGEVR